MTVEVWYRWRGLRGGWIFDDKAPKWDHETFTIGGGPAPDLAKRLLAEIKPLDNTPPSIQTQANIRLIDAVHEAAAILSTPTAIAALQAIADLPTPKNPERMNGHEDAYRAVERLFATPPYIESSLPPAENVKGIDLSEFPELPLDTRISVRIVSGELAGAEIDNVPFSVFKAPPPRSQMVVPPGYVLVPMKPTKEMAHQAACYFYGKRLVDIAGGIDGISMANRSGERSFWFAFKKFWRAALANAPQPSCPPPVERAE